MTEKTIYLTGKLRDDYPQYEIATYDLFDENTREFLSHHNVPESQLVVFKGKPLRTFSDRYKVLPNPLAVNYANDFIEQFNRILDDTKKANVKAFADKFGHLTPYNLPEKIDYYNVDKSMPNVCYNNNETVMTAFYHFENQVNIGTENDKDMIDLQTGIRNSINGFCGFDVFLHTFRIFCKNQMWHILRSEVITEIENLKTLTGLKLGRTNLKHTKALDKTKFNLAIETVISKTFQTIEDYSTLRNQRGLLEEEQAKAIIKKLPDKLTSQLDFIHVKENKIEIVKPISQWEAFNTITNKITFNKYKAKKDGEVTPVRYESAISYMRNLQQIFVLR